MQIFLQLGPVLLHQHQQEVSCPPPFSLSLLSLGSLHYYHYPTHVHMVPVDSNVGAVIGGVVGGLILAIFIILIVVLVVLLVFFINKGN